jgi:hypothetical protein
VCLELNARALVSSWKVENLDDMNVGWLGVFITPTTGRWVPTVGALSCGPAWLSGGAPDKSCRLSDVPPARALSSALQSTVAREVAIAPLAHRTVR